MYLTKCLGIFMVIFCSEITNVDFRLDLWAITIDSTESDFFLKKSKVP